jgi:hypothetical protein
MKKQSAANELQQFHLVIDLLPESSGNDPDGGKPCSNSIDGLLTVALPAKPAVLLLPDNGELPRIASKRPSKGMPHLMVEPVRRGLQQQLVVVNPSGAKVRVNGMPAPRVAILGEKDQLQVGPACVLHVTIYNDVTVKPASEAAAGEPCPICRVPIDAGTTVYTCPGCGAYLHCEGEEKPEGERLECARTSTQCPTCELPIVWHQGFSYRPELYSD